jgi:hypothetical protein
MARQRSVRVHMKRVDKSYNIEMLCSPMHFSTLENDIDTVQSDFDSVLNATDFECKLRRNTAAGSTSGLQIFFKRFNHSERLINASKITGQMAVRVRTLIQHYDNAGCTNFPVSKPHGLFVRRHMEKIVILQCSF